MHNTKSPPQELGFPSLEADPKSWFKNLGVLLYQGGASKDPSSFPRRIASGEMGEPQLDRLPLVQALHRALSDSLSSGMPAVMLQQRLSSLKMLYRFAERTTTPMTFENVVTVFCAWTDFMIQRSELAKDNEQRYERDCGPLTYTAAYEYCMKVSRVLDAALDRPEGLMVLTKMRPLGQHSSKTESREHGSEPNNVWDKADSISIPQMEKNFESKPDLRLKNAKLEKTHSPLNLNIFLYKGGAAANARNVQNQINSGALGFPLQERLHLVCGFHEELSARLTAGGSPYSIAGTIKATRKMFAFCDENGLNPSKETIVDIYCAWVKSLIFRTKLSRKNSKNNKNISPLKNSTAYTLGTHVGGLLNSILDRHTNIIELTSLESESKRPSPIGRAADKENLANTFAYGHMLQDICDTIKIETIKSSSLPISIRLRSGDSLILKASRAWTKMNQAAGLGIRYSLANARIESELSMFIGQTGMNSAQAVELELRRFFYTSHNGSYQVRDHKERRGGPVLFEIFKGYKSHFERYLEWRNTFFPDSSLVFPLIREVGALQDNKFHANFLRVACKQAGIAYVPPRSLRGTRVNWLLRRTADPDVTAEMAQHTKATLLHVYHRPSYQRTLGETIQFWKATDPTLVPIDSVAPGKCEGHPEQGEQTPRGVAKVDCKRASGCLWCLNHKDIDSLDYVWALVTFKQLKIIELSKGPSPRNQGDIPPSKSVIDRVDEKLAAFEASSDVRRGWVLEAKTRIEEEDFHPSFGDEILELLDNV